MKSNTRIKIIIISIVVLFLIGGVFLAMELFYPRECGVSGIYGGKDNTVKLEKPSGDGKYYISFTDGNNKTMRVQCTEKQYKFFVNGRQYYIIYKLNFFNRNEAKITEISNTPVSY